MSGEFQIRVKKLIYFENVIKSLNATLRFERKHVTIMIIHTYVRTEFKRTSTGSSGKIQEMV